MRKRNLLFIALTFILVFTLTSCKNDNTPKAGIPVSEARTNTQEQENITTEIVLSYPDLEDANAKKSISFVAKQTENNVELNLTVEEETLRVVITNIATENPTFIFDASVVSPDDEPLWVSVTLQELIEFISSQINPDDQPSELPTTEIEAIIEALQQFDPELMLELLTFVSTIDDEYFTVEGQYYVFNNTGKNKVKDLAEKLVAELGRLLPESGIQEIYNQYKENVSLEYEVKVNTGNKYIKEVIASATLTSKEDTSNTFSIELVATCKKIGTTTVNVPENTMSFNDFIAQMQ